MTVRRVLFVVFTAAILIFTAVSCDQELLPKAVESITLDKSEIDLFIGDTAELVASVLPEDASDKTITWTSSKDEVASVKDGVITAVGEGTATITAKAGEKEATCQVKVSKKLVSVSSITLDKQKLAMLEGEKETLNATVMPDDATDPSVTWSSSNEEVATVKDGVVTALVAGKATITATAGEKTASCEVAVSIVPIPATAIRLDKSEVDMINGETTTLVATVTPADTTDRITWESDKPEVVTVEGGVITAVYKGSATVTVRAGEQSATCAVTVVIPVSSITLDETELTMDKGKTVTLTATVLPEDASDETVKWSTSNDEVATVKDGAVTAIAAGKATITATAGDKSATCDVTVIVPATGITLDQETLIMNAEDTATLKATVSPDDVTDKTEWTSSNTAVATVENGKVTAVGAGKATITAKAGEHCATCAVTVKGIYKITFDANDGSGSKAVQVITVDEGSAALTKGSFAGVDNAQFVGWNTESDYSGDIYTDTQTITPTSSMTLYAQWVPAGTFEVVGGELRYNLNIYNRDAIPANFAVPRFIDGSEVTSIGESVFSSCDNLEKAAIPDSVTKIGEYAFYYSFRLKEVGIPDSVTEIGNSAFHYSGLEEITIPEAVTSIGEKAFYETYLKKVSIPSSVTSIGPDAFSYCGQLSDVTFADGSKLASIGGGAFNHCTSLESISIPSSVTTIGSSAFKRCTNLKSVVFSDGCSIDTIAASVFEGCSGLETITIPETVSVIDNEAFRETGLVSITIPASVTRIGDNAFISCNSLETLVFADGSKLDSIGDYAFKYGLNISGLTIPASVTSIGKEAFKYCYPATFVNESEVKLDYTFTNDDYVYRLGSPSEIAISPLYTRIAGEAFKDCTNLISITIPSSVTSIGTDAFKGCNPEVFVNNSGVELNYEFTNADYVLLGSPAELVISPLYTSIGRMAFWTCEGLTGITIPDTVTIIGYEAFYKCTGLKSIIIPDSVTTISDLAFSYSGLESITIPDTVTSLGDCLFQGCSNLSNVTLPKGLKSIGQGLFQSCTGLKSIEIPNTVTAIGRSAFEGCTGLKSIEIPDAVTEIGDAAFATSGIESITIPEGVTTISMAICKGCAALKEVSFPSSVTGIELEAFHGCTSLESVTIPSGVTTIGRRAFMDCSSLDSVIIPASVTSIGENAFLYCFPSVFENSGTHLPYSFGTAEVAKLQSLSQEPVTELTISPLYTSISKDAFRNNSNLTSVTIPDSVTYIGSGAFYGCSKLDSVTILGTSVSINSDSFKYCYPSTFVCSDPNWNYTFTKDDYQTGLMSPSVLVISPMYTNIVTEAFMNNMKLTSVTIPSSVKSIGADAFKGCNPEVFVNNSGVKLEYEFTNAEYVDLGCPKDLVISPLYTSIADAAFYAGDNNPAYPLETVTIPDTVTSIGAYAFCGCENLGNITLPDDVTRIEDATFYGCSSLKSFNIPAAVTYIGSNSLSECDGITSITIPKSVTEIGSFAFAGCSNLASVTFEQGSTLDKIDNGLFEGCTMLSIISVPSTVKTIGYYAFEDCTSLASFTIPGNVTVIKREAFEGCENLTSIIIPESVTEIGPDAFKGCSRAEEIIIPASVTSIGGTETFKWCYPSVFEDNSGEVLYYAFGKEDYERLQSLTESPITQLTISSLYSQIADGAFKDNTSITSITIPDSLAYIRSEAFSGCTNLTSVTIGDNSSLCSIGDKAFYGCRNLESITIPANVPSYGIGTDAFKGCNPSEFVDKSTSVSYHFDTDDYQLLGSPAELSISPMYASIGNEAFKGNTTLTSITIPASVYSIGSEAFYGCSNLDNVTILGTNVIVYDDSFRYCYPSTFVCNDPNWNCAFTADDYQTGLKSPKVLVISPMYTSIAAETFKGNTDLTSITIPSSVSSIGESAFAYCTGLTSIIIPDSVISIGDSAFKGCTSLSSVTLPKKLKSIGNEMLYECTGLGSITIPDTVETIGYSAFFYCSSLTSVSIPDSVISIGERAFARCTGLTGINLPSKLKSITDYLFFGCTTLSSITIPSGVNAIGSNAFEECTGLTSIDIPSSVTAIGTCAFSQSGLMSITIPDGIETIDSSVFSNCVSLKTVSLPTSVTTIGSWAFYGCTSLESVTIPNGVTSIGWYAFYKCRNLASITIPASVTSIDSDAFNYCNPTVFVNDSEVSVGYDFSKDVYKTLGSPKGDLKISSIYSSIGFNVFTNNTDLTGITIPASVKNIANKAFMGCTELASVVFEEGAQLNTIHDDAFNGCSKLTSITIPATTIESRVFSNCTSLTSVTFSASVKYIGSYAFNSCSSLESVTFAEGSKLYSIGSYAFEGCAKLATVNLEKCSALTKIFDYAFSVCDELSGITIPASVTTIGSKEGGIFRYCPKPITLTYLGTAEQWNKVDKVAKWDDDASVTVVYNLPLS